MSPPLRAPFVGCDLVDVARFQRMLERCPRGLPEQLFTARELRGGLATCAELAASFAVKEAVLKSLGTGLWEGLSLDGLDVRFAAAAMGGGLLASVELAGAPFRCQARAWLTAGHAHAEVLPALDEETPCASC